MFPPERTTASWTALQVNAGTTTLAGSARDARKAQAIPALAEGSQTAAGQPIASA
jgi:hypothetical protein